MRRLTSPGGCPADLLNAMQITTTRTQEWRTGFFVETVRVCLNQVHEIVKIRLNLNGQLTNPGHPLA